MGWLADSAPRWGADEDFVHQTLREFWLSTGRLTPAEGWRPVGDMDDFRDLSFRAAWGSIPYRPNTIDPDPDWGGLSLPAAWAQGWAESWADLGPEAATAAGWAAGYA